MSSRARSLFAFAPMFAVLGCAQQPQSPLHEGAVLKQDPAMGTLPTGMVVYVDDDSCPKGEIKKLTGGSVAANVPRDVRCVKRPQ